MVAVLQTEGGILCLGTTHVTRSLELGVREVAASYRTHCAISRKHLDNILVMLVVEC
jgi:hypothetical protein